ncbi:hypothetical protein I302_100448 [Kwoniella bestiolae CBS 10118]|uniref:Uncharacterized protein n=1 Tax=Kwoniella bestiolae CBS 10118 TaxID=1296100 RepID=A0AAJ8M4I6_9TREE
MKTLARFILSSRLKPRLTSIVIVNLGGYAPRTSEIHGAWNHPYDLDIAMGMHLLSDRRLNYTPETAFVYVALILKLKVAFLEMEEYLWKEDWYGIFRVEEVQRWIPYLV